MHGRNALMSLSVDHIFPIAASKLFGRDQMIIAQGNDWRVSWLQLPCRLVLRDKEPLFFKHSINIEVTL